jgi:hypothetical protein
LRRRGSFAAAEKQAVLVLDDPLDHLAAAELHGLGDGGGKVDVPLLTVLVLDKLHFGGESHTVLLYSSYITRYRKTQDGTGKDVADSTLEENLFPTSQRAKHESTCTLACAGFAAFIIEAQPRVAFLLNFFCSLFSR